MFWLSLTASLLSLVLWLFLYNDERGYDTDKPMFQLLLYMSAIVLEIGRASVFAA